MVSSLRLDVDARRRKVDEILATVRGVEEANGVGLTLTVKNDEK